MLKSNFETLKKIVNYEFSVNLNHVKTRKGDIKIARKVFSKILLDRKVSLAEIGKQLGKNHATVINYKKTIDKTLKCPMAMKKYKTCLSKFNESFQPAHAEDGDMGALVNEVYYLREKTNTLSNRIKELKRENRVLIDSLSETNRLGEINEMIKKRVPYGEEKQYYDKILRMLNGSGLKEFSGYEHIHNW